MGLEGRSRGWVVDQKNKRVRFPTIPRDEVFCLFDKGLNEEDVRRIEEKAYRDLFSDPRDVFSPHVNPVRDPRYDKVNPPFGAGIYD